MRQEEQAVGDARDKMQQGVCDVNKVYSYDFGSQCISEAVLLL